MNAIPKKYLTAANASKAYMLMRKWLRTSGEATVMEHLLKAYGNAPSADKCHLGAMMAMIYEMKSRETAEECAGLFGHTGLPGMSVGESILVARLEGKEKMEWLTTFSYKVRSWQPLVEEIDTNRHPLVFSPNMSGRVLTISKEEDIYAFRNNGGELYLVCIGNTGNDILIDEDGFGETPLYFTVSTHFVSPVFKLRLANHLLNFVLAEIGYPSLHTRLVVVFNAYDAILINYDEYASGGDKADEWEDIEVYMRKDYPDRYIFTSASGFFPKEEENCLENNTASRLIEAMAATSILYQRLRQDGKDAEISAAELRKYSRTLGLFDQSKK